MYVVANHDLEAGGKIMWPLLEVRKVRGTVNAPRLDV